MAKVDPGEIRNVVVHLRKLLAAYDDAGFVVRDSFADISDEAEVLLTTLRPQLTDTSNGIYELLAAIESTDMYTAIRKEELQ